MAAIDFDEWCHHMHEVQHALAWLDASGFDARAAHDAFLAVLALAELLDHAYSDDERTATTLELTQLAVDELLDALAPWVPVDSALGDESVAGAYARMWLSCRHASDADSAPRDPPNRDGPTSVCA